MRRKRNRTLLTMAALALAVASTLTSTPQAQALDNGVGRTPPMGWNTWNTFGCNINETLIRQTADSMVSSGMRDLGYQYVVVDDCWFDPTRDSWQLAGQSVEISQRHEGARRLPAHPGA